LLKQLAEVTAPLFPDKPFAVNFSIGMEGVVQACGV
jgi:hypothetical protein